MIDSSDNAADNDETADSDRIRIAVSAALPAPKRPTVTQRLADVQSELMRIAAAPVVVNAEDVMGIRALAHNFNWPRTEVNSVVRLVQRWT